MIIKKIINKLYIDINNKECNIKSFNISKKTIIGKKVNIGKKCIINSNVIIGDYTYLNTSFGETYIDTNVEIGKFCSIAPNVTIGLGDHNINYISTHPFITNNYYGFIDKSYCLPKDKLKTIIGNDVWIGANVNIKRGVKIGHGAVIGMNSVVTKDIPNYAIAAGNPAKIIKYRFEPDVIKKLNKIEWWNMSDELLKKNIDNMYDASKFVSKNFNTEKDEL